MYWTWISCYCVSMYVLRKKLRVIGFCDNRHICATMLKHTGEQAQDIQKFLGYSTNTWVEVIYTHFDDSKYKTTIGKNSNYLSDK